jgi:hypothetical protein
LNTAGYGLRIKTEDIAKFGQMYLQKGKWNGKEILTENWVKAATGYQTKSQEGNGDWAQGYGYQFWRCKPGFYRGDGAFGQFCIVMPEQDAVFAVTSESWDMQRSMTTMWENLLPGIQSSVLAENPTDLATLKNELKSLALPVVKGSIHSSLSPKYNGKKFKLDKNDFAAEQMQFNFSKDGCAIITKIGMKETVIQFGWEHWIVNKETQRYIFPVPNRLHMPSKIAGTATWLNDTTLQLNARFVEAMHGDKITCIFDGNKVSVTFINTVAENTKGNPEKRLPLSGTM